MQDVDFVECRAAELAIILGRRAALCLAGCAATDGLRTDADENKGMVVHREVIVDVDVSDVSKVSLLGSIKTCRMQESQKLIFCCLGIFVCYFYYGIVQEKM